MFFVRSLGEYCVHIAAQRGNIDILRHLAIACNTDLNTREGRGGYTALHIACENQNADLIEFLLSDECKSKLQLETNTYGQRTAYQLAAMQLDSDAMDVLRRSGAHAAALPDSDDSDDDDSDSADDDYMSDGHADDRTMH